MTGGAQGDTVEFFDAAPRSDPALSRHTAPRRTRGRRGPLARTPHGEVPGTARANASQSGSRHDVAQVDTVSSTTISAVAGAQVGALPTLEATVSPAGAGGTVVFGRLPEVLAQVPVDGAARPRTSDADERGAAVRSSRSSLSGRDGSGRVDRHRDRHGGGQARRQHRSATAIANVVGAKVGSPQASLRTGDPRQRRGNRGRSRTVTLSVGAATVDGSGVATVSWTPAVEGQRVIRADTRGPATSMRRPMPFPSVAPASTGGGDGGTGGAPEASRPSAASPLEVSPLVRPSLTSRPDEGPPVDRRTAGHARRRREPMSDRRVSLDGGRRDAAVAAGFVVGAGDGLGRRGVGFGDLGTGTASSLGR